PIEDPTVADAELYVYVDVEDWLSLKMVDDSEGLSELKPEGATLNPASSKGTAISSENYVANNSIIDSGLMELLKIEPGFGAGVFDFYLMYDINVSAWLPDGTTIKSTGQSGSFPNANPVIVANDVQKYQIFAGTYQTTITYNISGNPMI
ncbi:MAG TPA: hypothetical protein DDZ89_03250, partial [Clostridiales bacterium]|nr:hypothetical protein [Clostridiales bacterium]